jgi:uncharacterized membrane protein
MVYVLVACIGAHADFTSIGEQPAYILMGFIWIGVHIVVLLGVGLLIRAPIFFVAVRSQANIGGAASAPVVATAFDPALAPVGALLAVAGIDGQRNSAFHALISAALASSPPFFFTPKVGFLVRCTARWRLYL